MVLRCTLLIALAAGAFAVPVMRSGQTCAVSTCPDTGKFNMETGSTYEYDYASDVKTMMLGASEEHSSLHMTASLHIEVLQKCEMALKMMDVRLRDSDPSDIDQRSDVPEMGMFKQKMEAKPLRFAWVDGKIEHICPEDDDEPWVVNVKRGILSGMQNTMASFDAPVDKMDIDISGRCPVKYSTSSGFSVNTMTKVKDMLGCVDGHTYDTVFHGVPYNVDSKIQSMPLMDSKHECVQDIRTDGSEIFMSKVVCKEMHMFRPFSTPSSGANTDVTTMMTFKTKRSGVSTRVSRVEMHEYLTFDCTTSSEEMAMNMRDLTGLLQEICQSTSDDVRPEAPAKFMQLIHKMRKLDTATLMQLHRKSKNQCDKAEKAFHDALGNLHTKAGVSVITSLLQSQEVTGVEAEIFVTSVSMISRPSLDIVSESRILLTLQGSIGRKAYLAVSSLVHNYCHLNKECRDETMIRNIIKEFEDNLNYNCDNVDHELALMSLKALGNVGGTRNSAQVLSRCMMNPAVEMELRVEAVKAFRRIDCDVARTNVMTLYQDMTMDSELRIHAYLQLMKCPSRQVLVDIKQQMQSEEINQVGSFVYTHLMNIIESSDPLKVNISSILMEDDTIREFDKDKRKFSRNMEMSLFSHMLNMGVTGESDLIFSEKSFVPRSLNLNLTANMFGHSMNLMEVGGRVEDLEVLLEKIFGNMPEMDQQQQQQQRGGRSMIDMEDINVLDGRYNLPRRDSPKASMYVKMFGNEIRYNDFHDLDLDALKDKYNYLDWLMKLAEQQEHELTKNNMILDAGICVPTIAGMPLKLTAEAATTMQMKTSGRLDVRALMANPSKLNIVGSLEPSAALVVTSMMGVDAHVSETGLKMVETMHTSTVLSGKIEFEQGKILSVDWNMPREKMEAFNLKSKFYVTHRGMDREQRMRMDSVWTRDECYDLSKSMGMELCAKASVPMATSHDAPLYPFTGPMDIDLYARKTDVFDKYHMEMTFTHEGSPDAFIPIRTSATMVLDTPNSRTNRRVDFSTTINYRDMSAEVMLTSPWKKMVFNADVTNEDALKGMNLVAMIDDTNEYSMRLRMPIQQKRNGYQFEPELTINYPGIPSPRIGGNLLFIANRKIDFSLRMRNVFSEPAKATGTVTIVNEANRWKREIEANIQTPIGSGTFEGFVDKQATVLSSRGELEWTGSDGQEQRVTVNGKLKNLGSATISKYQLESQWTMSMMPEYNGDMTLIVGFGKMTYVFDLDTGFDDSRRVQIKNAGGLDFSSVTKTAEAELKFKAPYKDMDHHYKIDHKHNKDEISTEIMGQIASGRRAGAEVELRRHSMSPLKTSSMIKLHWPGRQVQLTEELEEVRPNQQYEHKARLQLQPDYVITSDSTIRVRQPMLDIESTVNVPEMQPINVELEVRPVLSNLLIKGKSVVEGHVYTTELTMTTGGSAVEHFNRINFDLKIPQRHVTFTSNYNYERGMINGDQLLLWNADVDMDQKNELKYRLKLDRADPVLYVRVEFYPQKFVELDTAVTMARSMTGHATLKSNIADIAEVDMAGEYHVEFDFQPKTNGGLLKMECHADRMKVEVEVDGMLTRNWDKHELTIDIKTPMDEFTTMKVESSHDMTPKTLNMMGAFSWDNKKVMLKSDNTIRWAKKLYQGGLEFTSPFDGFEDLRMTASHQITDDLHVTNIDFNFGGSGPITLAQELTYTPGVKFDIDSTLTTPWRNYENMKVKCMIEKDGMTMRTSNEFMWARNHKVTLDGAITKEPGYDFDFNFVTTTPWEAMPRFAVTLENKKRGIAYVSKMNMEYAPNKFVKVDSNIDVTNYKKLMMRLEVPDCEWVGVTSLEYEMKGEMWNHDMTVTFTSSAMAVEPIMLTTELDMRDLFNAKFEMKMTSPIGLRSMDLMMTNMKNGRVYNTRCTLTLPRYTAVFTNELRAVSLQDLSCTSILTLQGDEYRLVSSVSGGNTLEVSCMLHTPLRNWPQVGFELTHDGTHSDFHTKFDVTYGRNKKMETHCKFEVLENGLKIDAAIVGLMNKDFTLKLDHTGGFYDMMTTNLDFHYGRSARADNMQQYFGAGYDQSLIGRMMALLDKEVDIKFEHSGNIMDFTSTLTCKADSSTIKTTLQFGIRGRRFGGYIELETPFPAVSTMKCELKHNGVWNDFTNEVGFTLNRRQYKIVNTFNYGERGITIESTLTTPIDDYERNTMKLTHSGSLTNFNSELEFMIGGQETKIVATLETGDRIKASLDLTTPLEACRTLIVNLEHNSRNWRNFNSELDVTLNGRAYTGNMLFKLMQENMRVEVSATAPGKTYGLNIRHRGDINDFDTTCVVSSPDGNVEVKVSHKKTDSVLESSIEVKTPLPGYRLMSGAIMFKGPISDMEASLNMRMPFEMVQILNIAAKHRGSLFDFDNELSLTIDDDITTLKCNFLNDDSAIKGELMLNTPYADLGEMGVEVDHKWLPTSGFTTMGLIVTPLDNFRRQSIEMKFHGPMTNLEAELKVMTSYPGYRQFMLSATNKMMGEEIVVSAKLVTPIQGYETFELTLSHVGGLSNFMTNVVIETSVQGSRRMSAQLNHNMEDGIETKLDVSTPWDFLKQIKIHFKHTPRPDGYDIMLDIITPFENFEEQGFTMSYTGEDDSFKADAKLEWKRKTENIEGEVEYDLKPEDRLKAKVKLTSTLRNYDNIIDMDLDHKFLDSGFSSELKLKTPIVEPIEAKIVFRGNRYDFVTNMDVEYAGSMYKTECTFRCLEGDKMLDWKLLDSPWTVRTMNIKLSHKSAQQGNNGEMALKINNNNMIDSDYSYTKQSPYNLRITVRQPYPITLTMNCRTEGSKTITDMRLELPESKVMTADMEYETNSGWYTVDEKIVINMNLPSGRRMKLDTMVSMEDSGFTHTAMLQWAAGQQATWEVTLHKTERSNRITYDGTLKLESPMTTGECSVSHVIVDHKRYTTTLTVPGGMTFTRELYMDAPNYMHKMELTHPRLRRGLKHEVELIYDPDNCKILLDHVWMLEDVENKGHFLLEDQSGGRRERVVYEYTMNYPSIMGEIENYITYVNDRSEFSIDHIYKKKLRSDRNMVECHGQMKLDRQTSEFNMMLKNPTLEIHYVGSYEIDNESGRVYKIVRTWDDAEMTLSFGREDMTVFTEMTHKANRRASEDKIRVQLERHDAQNVDFKVLHTTRGREVEDIKIAIVPSGRQGVTVTTFFRQNMMLDLSSYVTSMDMSDLMRFFEWFMEATVSHVTQLRTDVSDFKDKIIETLNKPFGDQMRYLRTSYQRIVRNNDFYLGDITNMLEMTKELMYRQISRVMNLVANKMQYFRSRAVRMVRAMFNNLNEVVNAMETEITQFVNDNLQHIQNLHAVLERVVTTLDEMVRQFNAHPLVQWYYSMLEQIRTGEFMRMVHQWKLKAEQYIDELKQTYQTQIDIIYDIWRNIERMPLMRQLTTVMQRVIDFYEYISYEYDFEGTLEMIADRLSKITWRMIKERVYDIMKDIIRKWDPSNLDLELNLYWPTDFMWDVSPGMPDLQISDSLAGICDWIKSFLPSYDWSIMDYYYAYKPSSKLTDMMPPFKSWATISGSQHYVTFDKRFYAFEAECDYLLARDFIDGKFSVVVSYAREGGEMKRSIIVMDGNQQVKIMPDGQIMKDGRSAELPMTMAKSVVLRVANMVLIKNKHGLNVECDLKHDRCTLEVTGWYHGKTAGLMGTYDNEPVNDLIKNDGSRASSIDDFTKSWAIKSQCRNARNLAVSQEPVPETPAYTQCQTYFNNTDSIFRRCFNIVKPWNAMRMCVNDIAKSKGICHAVDYYYSECRKHEVHMHKPKECLKCKKVDNREYQDELTVEGNDVPQSADVVFVIQHADCNNDMIDQLSAAVGDLEQKMTQTGLTNNRYGIVGYGSLDDLNEPHTHTMDGQIFNTQDKFTQGIRSWMDMQSGNGVPDVLKAIKFAAKYPFRTGVSKTIVVIPCNSCDEVQTSYRDVMRLLTERDIRLHVVMDHEFKMKPGVEKSSQINYGADKHGIFTKKHGRGSEVESDRELNNLVHLPSDLCTSMSHSSDGTVFDVNQLTHSRRAEQKKFTQVMVKVIADGAKPTTCQRCMCVPNDMGAAMSVCKSCSSNAFQFHELYPAIIKHSNNLADRLSGYGLW